LRNAGYRRWLVGNAISLLGDQFTMVALPWLVLQHLGSARMLGMVMMAGAVPRAVLLLVGGAAADRTSARLIMVTMAATRAACVAAIGVLLWCGSLSTWEIYGLVVVFGIADAFAMPAHSAYVPSLLKREQLVVGSSLGQVSAQLAVIVGPLAAGLAIAALGIASAFFVDAVSFLFVIGALLRLPDPPRAASHASRLAALGEGITHVLRDVPLRTILLLATAMNFCISGPVAIGVAELAKSRFHSASAYGIVLSAVAVGQLGGALSGSVWKIRRCGALILGGGAWLGMCLMGVPFARGVSSVAAVLLLMGATASLVNVHIGAWVMARIDPAVRGRVASVLMLASLGAIPVSMAVAGFIVLWSPTWLFVLAGVTLMIVGAGAAAIRSVRDIGQ